MLNSKQLHVHSLPLLVFSMLSVATVMTLGISAVPLQQNDVMMALTHPAFAVQKSLPKVEARAANDDQTKLSGLGYTGERMVLQLSLEER